ERTVAFCARNSEQGGNGNIECSCDCLDGRQRRRYLSCFDFRQHSRRNICSARQVGASKSKSPAELADFTAETLLHCGGRFHGRIRPCRQIGWRGTDVNVLCLASGGRKSLSGGHVFV